VTHFHEIRYKYKPSDTRDSSEVYFKSQFLLRTELTGQYTAIHVHSAHVCMFFISVISCYKFGM